MQSAAASAAEALTRGPLRLAELAATLAAIGGFEARPRLAVAVSGGPDSMALALLAERWASERGGAAVGLIVDHLLRPDSTEEARRVACWLAARGMPKAILRWEGAKPGRGIQAAARAARYDLLAGWCRANGVLHLLVAHHREDQAETWLIRRRAGSGEDGLAAMAAVRELRGCRLVRPLLAVPRARLAAFLAAEGQPFVRDPSNLNPQFERARLRLHGGVVPRPAAGRNPDSMCSAGMSVAPGSGAAARNGLTTLEQILDETRRCAARRIAREQALDQLIGGAVTLHPAGFAAIDGDRLAAADDEAAERLLGRVAATLGGLRYAPRRARLARLRAGLRGPRAQARTLGGCRFVPWRAHILALRELAAAAPPVRLEPGAQVVWDRFVVDVPTSAAAMTLGYLGRSGVAGPARQTVARDLPPLVRPVLPAFWDAHGLVAVPHLGYRREGIASLPALAFSPPNGTTTACFTVV